MDSERSVRQDAIDQALASVRLEGLEPTEEAMAIARRFAGGELTIAQMGEEIRALNARIYGPLHVSGE
jgi:hypothetical protein